MDPVRFVNTIFHTLDPNIRQDTIDCLQNKNEAQAGEILTQLHNDIHPKSALRYRFLHASKQDQLIKAVFDIAIKNAPNQVERAAGNSLYPLWKRVVWIDTPRALSSVLGNILVKLLISGAVISFSISVGYVAYNATTLFLTGPALTLIINKVSIQNIRLFKATMDLLKSLYNHRWIILALTCIVHPLPEIPYLTRIARTVNYLFVMVLLRSPETIVSFVWKKAFDVAIFGWDCCNDMSMFLRDIAEKSEANRLDSLRPQGYTLWIQSLQKVIGEAPV